MRESVLQKCKCHICNSNYEDIGVGRHHIVGTCPKCQRTDEIGLVFK